MDRRGEYCNATASAADSLWREAARKAKDEEPKAPHRHPSGRWSCCGGYGEHMALCDFATWERRA